MLAWPFGIYALVKIDPQDAGKECDCGRERQEQDGGPEDNFSERPSCEKPQQGRDWRHDQDAHGKAEVHSAQKVARFPLELEVADGTALAHLWESAKDGIVEDSADAAARAALFKNTSQR